MSVTEISDIKAPTYSGSLAGGATITRRMKAVLDTINEGPITILAHASCPNEGDTYTFRGESDSSFVCNAVTFDPKSDSEGHERGLVYDITATYSNQVDATSLGDDEDDPLDDEPDVSWDFKPVQVVPLADLDGLPVVNGADEAFDPPHTIDEYNAVCVIVRNEATYNAAIATEWANAVNSDNFAGVDPGYAKMAPPKARRLTRGEFTYFQVTYEIEFSKTPWNPTGLLAQGYKYRPSAGALSRQYIDPTTGQPPSSPILLNTDGTKNKSLNEQLAAVGSDPVEDGEFAIPVFHEFRFFPVKAFGVLNLGL